MAVIKTDNGQRKYKNLNAKEKLCRYILRKDAAIHGFYGGVMVDTLAPDESMQAVSEQFGKANGVQVRHFIVSFGADEVRDPAVANEIALQVAAFVGRRYQVVYAVHENTENLHFHLVHNSVSYVDGQRYYGTRGEFRVLRDEVKRVLRRYGVRVLEYKSSVG